MAFSATQDPEVRGKINKISFAYHCTSSKTVHWEFNGRGTTDSYGKNLLLTTQKLVNETKEDCFIWFNLPIVVFWLSNEWEELKSFDQIKTILDTDENKNFKLKWTF